MYVIIFCVYLIIKNKIISRAIFATPTPNFIVGKKWNSVGFELWTTSLPSHPVVARPTTQPTDPSVRMTIWPPLPRWDGVRMTQQPFGLQRINLSGWWAALQTLWALMVSGCWSTLSTNNQGSSWTGLLARSKMVRFWFLSGPNHEPDPNTY